MAKASIQLKGMLVVYLVSLSRAWTKVALGRSASGDTVLVARVVPVPSVHTSPSFSLGSSSQAWQSFPRLRWIRRMPEATSLLETTMSWAIKGCQQGESAAHAHRGIICTWNVLCNDHRGERQRNAKNPNLLTVLLWILALTCWFPTLSLEKEEKPSPSKCLKSTAVFTS